MFERARVDPAECEAAIELRPLTEEVFSNEVVLEIVADLDADFEEGLEQHGSFIAEALWELSAGDWKSLTSRVRHFNRLLPPAASGKRVIHQGDGRAGARAEAAVVAGSPNAKPGNRRSASIARLRCALCQLGRVEGR